MRSLIILGILFSTALYALPFKVKTSKLMGLKVYAKEHFRITNGKNLSQWRGAAKYYKNKNVAIEVKVINNRETASDLTIEIFYLSEAEKNKVYQVHHKHVTSGVSIDRNQKYVVPVKQSVTFNYKTRDKYNLSQFEYDKHYKINPRNPDANRYPRSVELPGESTEYVAYVVILKDGEGKIVDGASNSSKLLNYLGTLTTLKEGDKMNSKGVKE